MSVAIEIEYHSEEGLFHINYDLKRYVETARRLEESLRSQLEASGVPHKVLVNPGPGEGWESFTFGAKRKGSIQGWYARADNQLKRMRYPRLGAFEVSLCFPRGFPGIPPKLGKRLSVWSKLELHRWPDPEDLATRVAKLLAACKAQQDDVGSLLRRLLVPPPKQQRPPSVGSLPRPPQLPGQAGQVQGGRRQRPTSAPTAPTASLGRPSSAPLSLRRFGDFGLPGGPASSLPSEAAASCTSKGSDRRCAGAGAQAARCRHAAQRRQPSRGLKEAEESEEVSEAPYIKPRSGLRAASAPSGGGLRASSSQGAVSCGSTSAGASGSTVSSQRQPDVRQPPKAEGAADVAPAAASPADGRASRPGSARRSENGASSRSRSSSSGSRTQRYSSDSSPSRSRSSRSSGSRSSSASSRGSKPAMPR